MNRSRLRAAGGLAAAALAALAPSAQAADTAAANTNITVAVRSITVDKTQLTCAPALVIPNGQCTTDAVRVTNGQADSHVLALSSQAFASNGQPPNWVPCRPFDSSEPCLGEAGAVGTDQFWSLLYPSDGSGPGHTVLQRYVPDPDFGTDGAATPGQSVDEINVIHAPRASTNPSPSFAASITWMAAP